MSDRTQAVNDLLACIFNPNRKRSETSKWVDLLGELASLESDAVTWRVPDEVITAATDTMRRLERRGKLLEARLKQLANKAYGDANWPAWVKAIVDSTD